MREKIITILIFFIVVASSFYFGFHRLENFSGVDEPYWSYGRVPGFWNAVKTMNWKKTNISDKPGVPLAIVSGAGLPFIGANPKDYKVFRYSPKTPEQLQKIRDIYFRLRLPVFLFTLAMLPVFYFLIKKLLGRNIARFSLLFIGLSPVLLGISLIINSDAMLWILTALSTLGLFVFLKEGERKYLVLSGFFLGLSVITKYVANILFVYFFLIFLLEYIFHAHRKVPIAKYLKQSFVNYAIVLATAVATAFVFFPATWVNLHALLNATIGNKVFSSTWPLFVGLIGLFALDIFAARARFSKIIFDFFVKYKNVIAGALAALFLFFSLFVFLHVWAHLKIFDLQAIIASPKGIGKGEILQKFTGAISADLYSLLFSVSPLILLLVLFSVGNIFRKKDPKRDTITAVYILIFIFLYYLGSTVNEVVTTVRYQIMVYPLVFVLAAIGVHQFLEIEKVKKNMALPAAFAVAVIVLLASLYFVKPHFLAYASEILPKNFVVNLKGMGEGSIEAADYLNSLPGAHEMKIWSDKGAVCEAFIGKCFIDFKRQVFEQNKIDYFVISTDRRSRSLKRTSILDENVDIKKLYRSNDYVFNAIIANNPNDFVRVYQASEFLIKKDDNRED
ncbi:MAG: glycosyltransferase family 39 protein [Candidatus Moranbacteria bacterium]|nr:glycosyltransferase family 39 protein [Candidatus Moranbacteria bacterium]